MLLTDPAPLVRHVPATYLGAVQGIAAIEQRIAEMRSWPGDFTSEIAAAHAFLMAIRATFGIRLMTEAELDAAHEQAVAELAAFAERDGIRTTYDAASGTEWPDVPVALDVYWNRGA